MNALSALGGAGRTPQVSGGDGNAPAAGGSGQDFAKLLDGDGNSAPKPKAQGSDKTQQQAPADTSGASKPPAQTDGAAEPTRDAQAGEQAVRDSDKPEGADKDTRADSDDDAGWPPAGLAGFGMAIMPALNAALPATATALGAAGLALGVAAAAAKGVAGVLGGDVAPATAGAAGALPGAAQAATGASAAVAAGDFTGLLAQAASATAHAATAEAAAPAAALAALAGAGDGAQPAGGDIASPDPSNLLGLGNTPAVSVARSADGAAPFTGSPTPTPDLHGDDFDDALGARMSWLADQKIGHAHIKLNPAELGPVEVRLQLSGDQVNASFSSAQADVRQALENSLPRLRELLGQQGFQLGQADVGSQQRNASSQNPAQPGFGTGDGGDDGLAGVGIPAAALRQRGLLDAYA
ncbi:flagellar hook-length control protein FliK [Xanthomonas sp. AmX2]|uniref:flagellar hook-length control protein FliK n=1 Tax=Xanthomonas sp. TaxID=29446 RepID=UPI0019804102|nr:flagellar hook-length control protein FliK [Xanthomonas sp.]MBN6150079.1 flagellar hook-length control protein FliK [Xanthomonas sp.]